MTGQELYGIVCDNMPVRFSAPTPWAQLPLDVQSAWCDAAREVVARM